MRSKRERNFKDSFTKTRSTNYFEFH